MASDQEAVRVLQSVSSLRAIAEGSGYNSSAFFVLTDETWLTRILIRRQRE